MNHFYADDSQLYIAFKPSNTETPVATNQVNNCVSDIKAWMCSNRLKLNDTKTELIVFSSSRNREIVSDIGITVGDSTIRQSESVRDLGVNLDATLTMKDYVNSLCRSGYMQLRTIGQLRPYISLDACRTLVNTLLITRTDYCNTLLYGIADNLLRRLQVLQNSAARLVFRLRRRMHVTPCLISLHWLPVRYRIQHRLATTVFKCCSGSAPIYLSSLIRPYSQDRSLRSGADPSLLQEISTRTKFGERAFSVAGPKIWNGLPRNLRQLTSLTIFKKDLKTHFCTLAYES